jgi:hypothetical protein
MPKADPKDADMDLDCWHKKPEAPARPEMSSVSEVPGEDPETTQVMMKIATEVINELNEQEIALGIKYTDDQRAWMLERRSTERITAWMQQQIATSTSESNSFEVVQELRKLRESMEANKPTRGPLDTANDFYNNHPFWSGVAGAVAYHKLKRKD